MIVQVQENEYGELFIQFPEQMMNELGWLPGDDLAWIVHQDGTIILKKKEEFTDA